MSRIQEVGEEIAKEINNLKQPYIDHAYLDDFSDTSGRIFVSLKMEKNVGKYWFEPPGKKPLRSISNAIHSVCKRMENEGTASCNSWEVPKATYTTNYGYKSYDGYEDRYISFDYDLL
jgi:hypothetical protein